MNFKKNIIFVFVIVKAAEMTPLENNIVAFMERPTTFFTKMDLDEAEIKQAYLLSVSGWQDVGTENFIKRMEKCVKSFKKVLPFLQFMDDKVPKNPEAVFTHNEDGTSYYTKRFHNETYRYVLSEHTCLPNIIVIQELVTRAVLVVEKEIVYPHILPSEQ